MIPFHLSLTRNLLGFMDRESTTSDWEVTKSSQVEETSGVFSDSSWNFKVF